MPFECGRTRVLLARALAEGDAEAAVVDARRALAGLYGILPPRCPA